MTHPSDLPYPVPEPSEWAEDLAPETGHLVDEAMADLAAGRSTVHTSSAEFEARLSEV
ncbi:hypothetical protein MXD63_14865 [Frankia sp. Cpl3]|nr:hypothetical protein [Frankia sp. Cpl3]